jgi:zinc protease
MTRDLVLARKALSASVVPSYPGDKHAGLMLVYGVPLQQGDVRGMEALLKQQLRRLVDDGVSEPELAKVKKASLVNLYGAVQSNSSMAAALCAYHANQGSWRALLRELGYVQGLGADEVARVARQTFRDDNCFAGYMLPLKA